MTPADIHAADEHKLHWAITEALHRDDQRDTHPPHDHADLLDECERRWGVRVDTFAVRVEGNWAWRAYTHGQGASASTTANTAPTRRLAELRALALALHQMGVLQ